MKVGPACTVPLHPASVSEPGQGGPPVLPAAAVFKSGHPLPSQFGKYLEEKERPEWEDKYLNYKVLKDLIKEAFKQQQETVRRRRQRRFSGEYVCLFVCWCPLL